MRMRARIAARLVAFVLAVLVPATASAQPGTVVEIRMVGSSVFDAHFDPVGVHVEPGTTIRFVNESGLHSSRSYSATPSASTPQRVPDGVAWWTPIGTDVEIVVEAEGVYDFFDPAGELMGMVGRIVVGDPATFPARDPSGLPDAAQETLPPVEAILGDDDGRLGWDEWQAQLD